MTSLLSLFLLPSIRTWPATRSSRYASSAGASLSCCRCGSGEAKGRRQGMREYGMPFMNILIILRIFQETELLTECCVTPVIPVTSVTPA